MDGASPSTTTRNPRRKWVVDVLHVFVLGSFAIAQPIYDLLGKHATYFVARSSKPIDVVALVLVLSLVLPSILAGCLLLSRALGRVCHTTVLALIQTTLIAGIVLPVTKMAEGWVPATLAAIGCGLLFALAYRKLRAVRLFLTLASPAILIFPVLFVFATPVSKIVFPQETPEEARAFSLAPESHVVLLVFDLLPVTALMDEHQNLDVGRYPGFARMQAQSVWYRQARTVSRATADAIPALLTGLYPREGALALLEDHPQNLFTLFGTAGDIHAYEPMTRLCPEALCAGSEFLSLRSRLVSLTTDTTLVFLHTLLPKRLTERLPPIDSQWRSFNWATGVLSEETGAPRAGIPERRRRVKLRKARKKAEHRRRAKLKRELNKLAEGLSSQDRLRNFEAFLDGLAKPAARNLSFLHLDLPHGPFLYLSSGKRYVPAGKEYRRLNLQAALGKAGGEPGERTWGSDPYLVDLAYQRLTHQIGLADQLVGRLLDRLEELDTLDRSMVIITADHGQNYEPNELQRSMADADTVHVPLFIKFPEQREAMIDDRAAEIIDLLPTIVDALELNVDWQLNGYSLRAGGEDDSALRRRDVPELERDLATRLRQKLGRVGSGSREIPVAGPRPELVGRRVVDLQRTDREGISLSPLRRVKLDQEALLANVDPGSDFIPAYLTGSVEVPGEGPPPDLALALNGTVQATLSTYPTKKGGRRFAAMVPESAFVAGGNTWAIFHLR